MFNLAKPKFHVVQAGSLCESLGVTACLAHHFRGHVHTDGAAVWRHLLRNKKYVDPAPGTKIQHNFARLERRKSAGIPA
jgi:hypothetical protein